MFPDAEEAVSAVRAEIDTIHKEWQGTLSDKRIELWSAAGSPTEPFQLAVPEETLKRRGTPDEFEQMSSKKGTIRFYTPELREAVSTYLSSKEKLDAALAASARRLYARFSTHFATWHRAVECAAEVDCLISLATFSDARASASEAERVPSRSMSSTLRCVCLAFSDSKSMRAVGPARQKWSTAGRSTCSIQSESPSRLWWPRGAATRWFTVHLQQVCVKRQLLAEAGQV